MPRRSNPLPAGGKRRGGVRVRALREAAGIDQAELARRLGIPRYALAVVENCYLRTPPGFLSEVREALTRQ